jgi:hypothetical protein
MMKIVLDFVASKGLNQGEPLSHLLFNFMAGVFSKMLAKAAITNRLRV